MSECRELLRRCGTSSAWTQTSVVMDPGSALAFARLSGMTSIWLNFKQRTPHLRDLAAYPARVGQSCSASESSEGAGNAGRSTRRSLACKDKKAHEHRHHGHTG